MRGEMKYLNLILPIVFIIVCLGLFLYEIIKLTKIKQTISLLQTKKEALDKEVNIEKVRLTALQNAQKTSEDEYYKLQDKLLDIDKQLQVATQRAVEAQERTDHMLLSEQKRLAAEVELKKQIEEARLKQDLEQQQSQIQLLLQHETQKFEKEINLMQNKIKNKEEEINYIQSILNEWKSKQDSINQQIKREEELQNTIDFHRINLSDSAKEDIHYLISIEPNIHNKELLHKLIWTEYIQRPFNQMLNNNFGSKVPKNVIYCIERISDKKKYIGKTSAEVSKRWTDHIKNSLEIGTIKHQPIHDALYKNWDNFTFSIIEEVKDDKLSEREKYYINFFETDKYGFNIKVG